jgi:DnaK suppressor protein
MTTAHTLNEPFPAELLDEGFLGERQTVWFKHRLTAMKARIVEAASTAELDTIDVSERSAGDEADRATFEETARIASFEQSRRQHNLREIDAALARITEGTFGYCTDTGDEIDLRRLVANPTALRTTAAQEVHDRRQSQFAPVA